jgi:hypothetical protein
MMLRGWGARSILLAAAALLSWEGAAAAQAQAPPPGQKKQAGRESNWPKKVKVGELTVSLDAPLAESLEGAKLKARGTARVQSGEVGEPAFATVWYEAEVDINHDRRTVTMTSVQVPRVELPGAPAAQQQRIAARLSQALSRQQPKLSLDDVLASTKVAGRHEGPPKLNTDPPKIIFETEPAILLVFDGEPRFRTVEGSKLERALNTPFLVLRVPAKGACYLSGGFIASPRVILRFSRRFSLRPSRRS